VNLLILLVLTTTVAGKIEQVRFVGNRTFGAKVLVRLLQSQPGQVFNEALLERDERTLELFYYAQGFFNATAKKGVVPGKKGGVLVTFYIQEGKRSRVLGTAFEGNRVFTTERLQRVIAFLPGSFYSTDLVRRSVQGLRDYYLERGYPFVRIQDSIEQIDTIVTVRYIIDEGPFCYIKDIKIRGNQKVRTRTILKIVEIKAGERFVRSRLEAAKRRLYATKLFSRSLYHIIPRDSSMVAGDVDSIVIRFDVTEQEQQGIGFGIGFETPPNRLLLTVDWEHNNIANQGQWVIAGTSYSPDFRGNYRLNFSLTYRIPYILWERIDFQTNPFFYYERLDSNHFRDYGIETRMGRDILPQLHLGIFNRFRLVADTARGISNSLALNLVYDTRDNFFDPGRGFYVQPVAEIAGGPLRGDNDFFRIKADCRVYQRVNIFVLAVRCAFGRAVPYGRSSTVPYYEEFSLGGGNNLRGYAERSLGPDTTAGGRYGPVVINGNLELRSPYLFNWVGLVGFLDCGQVAGQNDLHLRGIETGAGVGIRVRTPVGPVRLDWGKRLTSAPVGDRGRFYIGILHAF